MLTIKRFVVGELGENCYIVSDESREAVIIDCGAMGDDEHTAIESYIKAEGLTLKHQLLTHAHFDHMWGVRWVYDRYGLTPELNPADMDLYHKFYTQIAQFLGAMIDPMPLPPLGTFVTPDTCIHFGTHTLIPIFTPGHTPGGTCFHCAEEQVLFSGDSLFRYSIGRTDLPGGDMNALITSLKAHVLTLPSDTVCYPGHGSGTTVADERSENLYLR